MLYCTGHRPDHRFRHAPRRSRHGRSDCVPVSLRAALFPSVLRSPVNCDDSLPFALQWVWPLPLITGIIFAPESPWWLVRKGNTEQARRTIGRLFSKATDDELVRLLVSPQTVQQH